MKTKRPYEDWPVEHLAAELFAMRQAVKAHPEEAWRWEERIGQIERESNRRRLENTPLKTFNEPFGEIVARRLLSSLWARGKEPEYLDAYDGLLVAEDEYGWLWVPVKGKPTFERIRPWRPRHLLAVWNTYRRKTVMIVDWE